MNKFKVLILIITLCAAWGVLGCEKKAADSREAVANAKEMKTVSEQINYLNNQAKAFINSKQLDQAIQTAQYVLRNLDQNSQEAQKILEQAKEELSKAGKKAAENAGISLDKLGR